MAVRINAKTAAGAAKATHRALVKLATGCGYSGACLPTYRDDDGTPTITWEGLFDWAIVLSLGGSMLSAELGRDAYGDAAEIDVLPDGRRWFAEPVNGYQLAFYAN